MGCATQANLQVTEKGMFGLNFRPERTVARKYRFAMDHI